MRSLLPLAFVLVVVGCSSAAGVPAAAASNDAVPADVIPPAQFQRSLPDGTEASTARANGLAPWLVAHRPRRREALAIG